MRDGGEYKDDQSKILCPYGPLISRHHYIIVTCYYSCLLILLLSLLSFDRIPRARIRLWMHGWMVVSLGDKISFAWMIGMQNCCDCLCLLGISLAKFLREGESNSPHFTYRKIVK